MDYQFHLWPQDRYASLDEIASVVSTAEQLGYSAVASGEHILVPDGPEAEVIGHSYFDPMVLFTRLAGVTETIELLFCAVVIPFRHPALTARGVASLDHSCDGRFALVVGSGWAPGEFAILGLPFESRGPMTDEYVQAMRTLWTEDKPVYSGRFVRFPETTFEPKCIQSPHVPLWVGGGGPVALRRMREWGTGWIPMVATLEELSRTIAKMQDEVADAGRDPEDLVFAYHLTYGERDPYHSAAGESVAHATAAEPVVTSAEQAIEMVARYGAVGVNRIEVRFRWDRGPEQLVEGLQRFSEEVMPYTAAL